jgi:hypothetical protein
MAVLVLVLVEFVAIGGFSSVEATSEVGENMVYGVFACVGVASLPAGGIKAPAKGTKAIAAAAAASRFPLDWIDSIAMVVMLYCYIVVLLYCCRIVVCLPTTCSKLVEPTGLCSIMVVSKSKSKKVQKVGSMERMKERKMERKNR